jgi:hypothetical protein
MGNEEQQSANGERRCYRRSEPWQSHRLSPQPEKFRRGPVPKCNQYGAEQEADPERRGPFSLEQ